MPRLYLMRHGIAAGPEEDPPLTPGGRSMLRIQAQAMSRLGLDVEAILTSPLRRARETAECVAEGLGLAGAVRVTDLLRPGCRMSSLASIGSDERGILAVGHAPDMGLITAALSGLHGMIPFEQGAIACLQLDAWPVGPPARLVFLIPPGILCGRADP